MNVKYSFLVAAILGFTGCFGGGQPPPPDYTQGGRISNITIRQPINELEREKVPGTVDDLWVEPMIDHIRVPAAIDPHGVYYRPSHSTLAEIRPGRYQKVQYPDEYGREGSNISTPGNDRIVTPTGVQQK